MNGSHLRRASHLRTLAYSIWTLHCFLLPHATSDILNHVLLDPWWDSSRRPQDLQPSPLPSELPCFMPGYLNRLVNFCQHTKYCKKEWHCLVAKMGLYIIWLHSHYLSILIGYTTISRVEKFRESYVIPFYSHLPSWFS